MNQNELMHFGVKGMKWGKRKAQTSSNYTARVARGHAGPGKYLTSKRQLAGDKRDLDMLNKGGHLSVGLTKKRQEAYDKRDRAAIEKRIKNTEAKSENKPNKIARKDIKAETKQKISSKKKAAIAAGTMAVSSALAIYGGYKVSEYLKSEAGRLVSKQGFDYYTKNKTLWEDEPYLYNKVTNSVKEAAKYLQQNRK